MSYESLSYLWGETFCLFFEGGHEDTYDMKIHGAWRYNQHGDTLRHLIKQFQLWIYIRLIYSIPCFFTNITHILSVLTSSYAYRKCCVSTGTKRAHGHKMCEHQSQSPSSDIPIHDQLIFTCPRSGQPQHEHHIRNWNTSNSNTTVTPQVTNN
jgi:hypothetical protein